MTNARTYTQTVSPRHGQPASAAPCKCAPLDASRRGATLLVTLGVLTVLSVMVVTFLLSARHQRLSAKHFRDKTVARQALNVALARAMQFADDAMIVSNYIGSVTLSTSEGTKRRAAPVGRWYSEAYDNEVSPAQKLTYQTQDVLLVPVTNTTATFSTNTLSVNLLTPEVCRLLPPALTNRFGNTLRPLRSGWITDIDAGVRVSFAVLNTSGFIDAHRYDFVNRKPVTATQHLDRVWFTRQDLANAEEQGDVEAEDDGALDAVGIFSCDPGRDAIPLYPANNGVYATLGTRDFSVTNKFDLNSITNFFVNRWQLRATRQFEQDWLRPVTNALAAASQSSSGSADVSLGNVQKIAWNIANYMTPTRIPEISYPGVALPSRADYGVEDVPLINEVQVFKCTDNNGNAIADIFQDAIQNIVNDLQNRYASYGSQEKPFETIVPSNLYAAAVEVWYPFAPRPIPDEMRVYVGVYTNAGSVSTTTNLSWSASDLSSYYGLNNPSVAQLLVNLLNAVLENDAGTLTNSLFWSALQNNADLVALIETPSTFNETNLLSVSTGIAAAFVWVYTDSSTGLIEDDNPYSDLIYTYAPADTNIYTTAEAVSNYYATASNYVPVVAGLLTNRVNDIFSNGGGRFVDYTQTVIQKYLPASKVAVSGFPSDYYPKDGNHLTFNTHGFCAVTNDETLISFPVFEEDQNSRRIVFYPLGSSFHTWIRPLVAVREEDSDTSTEAHDGYEAVDEALLTEQSDGTISVKEWTDEGFYGVTDPRANAWASTWFEESYNTFGATNVFPTTVTTPGFAETPFIHTDTPFVSIGELGHIGIDRNALANNRNHRPDLPLHDTIDFATRAGAATLDRFTIASTNAPLYGLIQANTVYPDAVRAMFTDISIGWTNAFSALMPIEDTDAHHFTLKRTDEETESLTENWTNTLFSTWTESVDTDQPDGHSGWTCFADMLPDLSTNALKYLSLDFADHDTSGDADYYRHDYMEDVMRGIVDKVSFRQNIYVVIIAAQTLSPASTDEHPFILADQRAAVTVIRDAYTGRWTIANWTWLTE